MIGYVCGKVVRVGTKEIVVLTLGVGYRIVVTPSVLGAKQVGDEAEFHTYLSVRDDALELFGFLTEAELELFELLRSVSGIGPRTALGIVSFAQPSSLISAIALGDMQYLTKLSGIGKKSAEKIVLELRDKLKNRIEEGSTYVGKAEHEALEALESLGYNIRDVRDIVRSLAKDESDARAIVSKSLKQLGRRS